jgi:hypothetical protein
MTSVEEQIRSAAARNSELLSILHQTEYAQPAIQQQDSYIRQVEQAVAKNNADLKKLAAQREKEFKEHKSYNESVTKRFLYKASGQKEKFAARAEKEEREYFEVLRAEHHAQQEGQSLASQLTEAQHGRAQLEPDVSRHRQAQKDLDSLYQSIFAGPTPSFPEEDAQENAVQRAVQEYSHRETDLRAEDQVSALLDRAARAMSAAQYHVSEALRYSRRDMFGGGTLTDMMERNALSQAEVATAELQRTMQQAQSISAHVQGLPPIPIAQGSLMSDVLFDNIFTDMAFHEKIQDSATSLQRAAAVLQNNQSLSMQRRNEFRSQMQQASSRLANERQSLQKVREQIFERLAQGGSSATSWDRPPPTSDTPYDAPPPAYS